MSVQKFVNKCSGDVKCLVQEVEGNLTNFRRPLENLLLVVGCK